MTSTFALSTSMPLKDILWPKTIPSITMKWHFSQLRMRLVSTHLLRNTSRFAKQRSNELPNIEKSSMKTYALLHKVGENSQHASLKCG